MNKASINYLSGKYIGNEQYQSPCLGLSPFMTLSTSSNPSFSADENPHFLKNGEDAFNMLPS